jgi:hypothetical protein
MADAADSKSVARKGVWVQVPPPALQQPRGKMGFGVGEPHVLDPQEWQLLGKSPKNAIKQHPFCKSGFSEVGHLTSMVR